jgi:hypothetical protein
MNSLASSMPPSVANPGGNIGGAAPQGRLGFPLPNIRATVPAQYQNAFDRLVTAAKRVMYDPKTHALLQRQLSMNAPMAQKLAEGVAGLLIILFREAKGAVPPPVLIPAAIEIVGEAVEFVAQLGYPIDQATYKTAVALEVAILARKLGLNANSIGKPQGGLLAQRGHAAQRTRGPAPGMSAMPGVPPAAGGAAMPAASPMPGMPPQAPSPQAFSGG